MTHSHMLSYKSSTLLDKKKKSEKNQPGTGLALAPHEYLFCTVQQYTFGTMKLKLY